MPKVVALYSSAMQSGKSTTAEVFRQYGYVQVSFATPMKKMIATLLGEVGVDMEMQIRYLYGDLKTEIIPQLGVNTRHLMQTLGTEWGRHMINRDLWVHITMREIDRLIGEGRSVVVDDLRLPNEATMLIQVFEAELYRIVRPYQQDNTGHSSEGALDHWMFNGIITNDGSLAEFRAKIEALL